MEILRFIGHSLPLSSYQVWKYSWVTWETGIDVRIHARRAWYYITQPNISQPGTDNSKIITLVSDFALECPHGPDPCHETGQVIEVAGRDGGLWSCGLQLLKDPAPVDLELLRRGEGVLVQIIAVARLAGDAWRVRYYDHLLVVGVGEIC